MKMKKRSFFLWMLVLSLILCAFPVTADDGVGTASFMVDGRKVSTAPITNGSVTLVNAPGTVAGFCGWQGVVNGENVFLPAGAVCTGVTGDVTFHAVSASFVTDTGCSVRLRDNQVSLRFTSTINTADYEALAAILGGKDKISFGTYIVPARYVTDAMGEFTLEALAAKGRTQYIDVPATAFYKTTETTSTIAGSVGNILKGNYTLEYSGVGYMKLTYTDGSVGTVYAAFNQTNNSRSILLTILDAYNDRDESYDNLVLESIGSTHSPYTNTQLSLMRDFLDQVVLVGHDSKYNYFVLPTAYYTSPWKITFSSDDFERKKIYAEPPAGKTPSDAMGIYLDGKIISVHVAQIQNGKLVFEHNPYITIN
ncbi:MAG: hypothetical protein E7609_03260 [Ruminococcaceae bacterium]|nr:hypothetical protein [Oscillospiraceae bacterium]